MMQTNNEPRTAPRELTIAELKQAGGGGGSDHDRWTDLISFSNGAHKAGGGR